MFFNEIIQTQGDTVSKGKWLKVWAVTTEEKKRIHYREAWIRYKKAEIFYKFVVGPKGQYSIEILKWKMILDTDSPGNRKALSLT